MPLEDDSCWILKQKLIINALHDKGVIKKEVTANHADLFTLSAS